MKHVFLIIIILPMCFFAKAQTLEDSLKSNIDIFFKSMQTNDTVIMKDLLVNNCDLKSIEKVKEQTEISILPTKEFLKVIASPLPKKWEEKIINYTYLTDEIMATVWTDYEFIYDGKLSHSGVNQFTFIRNKQSKYGWQIISIIDTRYVRQLGDISKIKHEEQERENLNKKINEWHLYASNANLENFFSFMADSCIYKGTDKTERWNKTEFYGFCKPYFDKGKAWDFKPLERHFSFDDNLQTAWFDEKLDTWMGICKATGICQKINGEWKLVLYDLSVTIDNDKIKSFIELTKE